MTQHDIIKEYIEHGLSLVPIPHGTKGPRHIGWNLRESALRSVEELPAGYGVGIAHAYSGTMALDIDNWELAKNNGIDVEVLYSDPDAVIIHSGRAGRGKLLYKMPFGLVLPTKKIVVDKVTAFELRCGTLEGLTVQDVLPPSVHPDTGKPYVWAGKGNWKNIPVIPQSLMTLWTDILKRETTIPVDGVDTSWFEIRSALNFISPECSRDEWITVGMALQWAGVRMFNTDQALALWNEWSKQSPTKYPGEREILTQWNSFKSSKTVTITIGSLFHMAKGNGWTRPAPDATDLFGPVQDQVSKPNEILQNLRPAPPDIDLDLFPPILAQRAKEVSVSVGCDPLVPLFAGLAAVCGVVDARTRLELMPGFRVPPVLWLMTLGDPADKKSPGSRPMLSPLKNIEVEDRPRFAKEILDWEGKEAAYASAKRAYLEFAGSSDALLGEDAPEVPPLPDKPVSLKITVSDITSQKLIRQAADRPRGLLCYLDEMNSWVRKMTDRSSGEDRSAWVVSYESERYEMDRVGAGSVHADNLAVSVYGNIQPRVFRENVEALAADGLIQRFIPAVLRHGKTTLGHPIPDYLSNAEAWENMLRLIFALPETTYRLSPDAYNVYRNFQRWYEEAKRDERLIRSGDSYMTAFGKLEGLVGRIALVFHIIESPFSLTVSTSTLERAIRFVRSYVIPVYRYAFGEVGSSASFDVWMTDYIIQYCDQSRFTLSDLRRGARRRFENEKLTHWQQNQWIIGAMHNLELAHWVARVDDGSKELHGTAEWLVNPALKELFADHRKQVIRAKQRLREKIWENGGELSPKPRLRGYEEE